MENQSIVKPTYLLIKGIIAVALLFCAVVILGSSSTKYDIHHTVVVESGSTNITDSLTFGVSPLSTWRPHQLTLRFEYESEARCSITVQLYLTVNDVETEGYTESIEISGGLGTRHDIEIPPHLLRMGVNDATVTICIRAEVPPGNHATLEFKEYQVKTKALPPQTPS